MEIQVYAKVNFFFAWLILVDRQNTKVMLHMCNDQVEDDASHLFLDCPSAAAVKMLATPSVPKRMTFYDSKFVQKE
jgi:hypothetical protein